MDGVFEPYACGAGDGSACGSTGTLGSEGAGIEVGSIREMLADKRDLYRVPHKFGNASELIHLANERSSDTVQENEYGKTK